MGREVVDISMDLEPDPAVIRTNGEHHDKTDIVEKIKVDMKNVEENIEIKDYDVKECTMECAGEIHDDNGQEDQDVLCVNNTVKAEASKTDSNNKLGKSGNARSHCTVPQPFSLATEKRASGGPRPAGIETAIGGIKKTGNTTKKSQLQPNSHLESRKPLQPDNKKHPEEDDARSVASSTTSVKTSRSRTTVASAPKFRCTERADKRKEFYSKLEEKHRALEAEKTQCEARTKEERDAALKQLRKSLTFRANPMPSFYQEGPPPKVELKKLPTTRAKSPKFTRRKSYNDAVATTQGDKTASGRVYRHSLGSRNDIANPVANSKDQCNGQNGSASCRVKQEPKQADATNSPPPKISEQNNVDITVHS